MIYLADEVDVIARTELLELINRTETFDADMLAARLTSMEVDPAQYDRAIRSALNLFALQGLIIQTDEVRRSLRNGGRDIPVWEVCG